jgi:hypothetical protein
MSESTEWISLALAAAGLGVTTIRQIRQASSRRRANEAEQAGRLLDLLTSIDLGGVTLGLNAEHLRAAHDEQVDRLQQVIRIGAADFSNRALRTGLSWITILLLVFYSGFFAVASIPVLISVPWPVASQTLPDVIAAALFFAFAVGSGVAAIVSMYRRWRLSLIRKAAGIVVPGAFKDLRATLALAGSIKRQRRQRRLARRILSSS